MGKRKFESDTPTFAEVKALRKPRRESVWLPLDATLLQRIAELERQVQKAERDDEKQQRFANAEAPALREELDALREEAEAAACEFVFQERPRREWRHLIDAHPSKDKNVRWDEESFAPAAIAACCEQPEMTDADAQEVWDEWGSAAAYVLFATAVNVNEAPSRVPFGGSASGRTNGSAPSSTTAPREESVTPAS